MNITLHASRFCRILVTLLAILIGLESVPLFSQAQEKPSGAQLRIVILEGEGAINNIRQRTARADRSSGRRKSKTGCRRDGVIHTSG
jgi:hypothetical protein